MIPFASPLLHAAAITGGKTRAQFDAHVATRGLATNYYGAIYAASLYLDYVHDNGVPSYGSPWRPGFDQGFCAGFLSKIVGHCFPDEATRLAQVGKRVFIRGVFVIDAGFLGSFYRNGVLTDVWSTGELAEAYQVVEFLFHNDESGQTFRMVPADSSNNGPFIYDWT